MKNSKEQMDNHSEFFEATKIPYSRSKDEVWESLSQKLDSNDSKIVAFRSSRLYISIAASLALLISTGLFMRFYAESYTCPNGQHLSLLLKDDSKVVLNAGSTLKYNPYWWKISRKLKLEGEAYFEVKKGNKFTVQSSRANTTVLGTSFNIFARKDEYVVHCLTGKVQVKSKKGDLQYLLPNEAVQLQKSGALSSIPTAKQGDVLAWQENRFEFTATPLTKVIEELERQFDIRVEVQTGIDEIYTGNFSRGSSPMNTLKIVCLPFGLKAEKLSLNKYKIYKNTGNE